MRDYSVPLGDWIWVATDGQMPPQAALLWKQLIVVGPGVVEWQPHSKPEATIIERAGDDDAI
jgi:hypothetical protein